MDSITLQAQKHVGFVNRKISALIQEICCSWNVKNEHELYEILNVIDDDNLFDALVRIEKVRINMQTEGLSDYCI